LLEEVYNLEDALLVGGLINSLLRNADRVKIACLAQLVNVIAPIMTNAGGMFQQTIYYPYSWALEYGRGVVLNILVESSTYEVPGLDQVPQVDVAGSLDQAEGKLSLFVLNRDLGKSHDVEIVWGDTAPRQFSSGSLLTGDDLKASNSFANPKCVAPQSFNAPTVSGGSTKFEIPAHSYAVLQWIM
jgi:alpha-N-arabinofuranosidase